MTALLTLAGLLVPSAALAGTAQAGAGLPAWLIHLNEVRTTFGVPPLTLSADPDIIGGLQDHLALITSQQDLHANLPGTSPRAVQGNRVARVGSTAGRADLDLLDDLLAAPYHRETLLDPTLTQTYAVRGTAGALDVLLVYSGYEMSLHPQHAQPHVWPRGDNAGRGIHLVDFTQEEPDPTQYCPDQGLVYGAPITISFGPGAAGAPRPVDVTSISLEERDLAGRRVRDVPFCILDYDRVRTSGRSSGVSDAAVLAINGTVYLMPTVRTYDARHYVGSVVTTAGTVALDYTTRLPTAPTLAVTPDTSEAGCPACVVYTVSDPGSPVTPDELSQLQLLDPRTGGWADVGGSEGLYPSADDPLWTASARYDFTYRINGTYRFVYPATDYTLKTASAPFTVTHGLTVTHSIDLDFATTQLPVVAQGTAVVVGAQLSPLWPNANISGTRRTLTVQYRRAGTSAWQYVGSVSATYRPQGTFGVRTSVTATATGDWRFAYAGGLGEGACVSDAFRITVAAQARVSGWPRALPGQSRKRTYASVQVRIDPGYARVYLQRLDGRSWRTVAVVRSGHVQMQVPRRRGARRATTYRLLVKAPAAGGRDVTTGGLRIYRR